MKVAFSKPVPGAAQLRGAGAVTLFTIRVTCPIGSPTTLHSFASRPYQSATKMILDPPHSPPLLPSLCISWRTFVSPMTLPKPSYGITHPGGRFRTRVQGPPPNLPSPKIACADFDKSVPRSISLPGDAINSISRPGLTTAATLGGCCSRLSMKLWMFS